MFVPREALKQWMTLRVKMSAQSCVRQPQKASFSNHPLVNIQDCRRTKKPEGPLPIRPFVIARLYKDISEGGPQQYEKDMRKILTFN
jgi:hypothetical protein